MRIRRAVATGTPHARRSREWWMSESSLNIASGLAATAAGLLAAWVATQSPGSLPAWLSPLLFSWAVLLFGLSIALAVLGYRRARREPARITVIEGNRVEIIGLWDAIDHFRRATRWGEDGPVLSADNVEWHLNGMAIERFKEENRLGQLALYGKLPRATIYRVIRIDEMTTGHFHPYQAILTESASGGATLREDISVDYPDLLRLVRKTIEGRK